MPSVIVIAERRPTTFAVEAKAVLESDRFSEVNSGTFVGNGSASSVVRRLKGLDSYKKNRAGINIYYGSLSRG